MRLETVGKYYVSELEVKLTVIKQRVARQALNLADISALPPSQEMNPNDLLGHLIDNVWHARFGLCSKRARHIQF